MIVALLKAPINRTRVSANLRGPGQRWVRRINNSEAQDCIFDVTNDVLVEIMKKADTASAVGPGVPVTFSLEIDATNFFEVSDSYKEIIGGAFPNYEFNISDLPKDYVNNVIAGTSESVNINKSTEVKVAVMSFQLTAPGVPPIVIVSAHPQGTNETRNFVQKLNTTTVEAGYNKSS